MNWNTAKTMIALGDVKSQLWRVVARMLLSMRQHPKRVAGATAALTLSLAGGAFAVASIDNNARDVVVREVLESIPSTLAVVSTNSNASGTFTLFRSTTTKSSDTADLLLKRLGVFDAEAASYLRRNLEAQAALLGRAGRMVTAEATPSNNLLKLTARWVNKEDDLNFQRLVIEKAATGLSFRIETAPLVASHTLSSGTVESTLFQATDDANVPDAVAAQIAELFGSDIDFRQLRKGDRFSVVYETMQADGETLRAGKLLSAEFVNAGKTHQAMWFQEDKSQPAKGQYYTLDGNSLRKAFLASPLEFTRVSSGYGIRVHPITNDKKAHKGIDYAAPTGTPVRTVGDGVVEFAGVQRGYGNVIEIKHRDNKTTLFAHLSKIGVQKGQKVEQGDLIGAVGSTGFSTGPHLHFEFRVDGEHQDPLTLAAQSGTTPIAAAARPQFEHASRIMRAQLKEAASVMQASAE